METGQDPSDSGGAPPEVGLEVARGVALEGALEDALEVAPEGPFLELG